MRAEAGEAVDRLMAQTILAARGLAGNTSIVFSSDNAYRMGQHRLLPGKETAFDADIRVLVIIAGPGVPQAGSSVQNTYVNPTFVQLSERKPKPAIDGRSLVPVVCCEAPGGFDLSQSRRCDVGGCLGQPTLSRCRNPREATMNGRRAYPARPTRSHRVGLL
jgi:hypothetical protein